MKVKTIILFNLIAMSLNANAQAREPSETKQLETMNSIYWKLLFKTRRSPLYS